MIFKSIPFKSIPFKSMTITLASLGLFVLSACSSGNQTSNPAPAATPAASNPIASAVGSEKSSNAMTGEKHGEQGGKGGQALEIGVYHMELVPEKEADLTHLDVFLQKGGNRAAVPNAKITAQVQLPDGTQKTLEFKYDPAEKHYTAKLPGAVAGEYKVAILSDINGEKVNGRFNFKR